MFLLNLKEKIIRKIMGVWKISIGGVKQLKSDIEDFIKNENKVTFIEL